MTPSAFDPGPLAPVQCIEAGVRPALVFEKDFAQPPSGVWAVLTEPDLLERWAPFRPQRALDRAGALLLRMEAPSSHQDAATQWVDLPAHVEVADAPALLVYTWGEDELQWALQAMPSGGTRLILTHSIASLDWVPKMAAGWHLCLLVAQRLLDGHPIARITGLRARQFGWDALHEAYAKELGIVPTAFPEE